jgi:hypothetical protein
MTANQRKLIEDVFAVKDNNDYDARNRGVELFGHRHRTAKSLMRKPVPMICIEDLGEYRYRPYAFYVHNPLLCGCTDTVLKVPYLIDFCKSCRGVVKDGDWHANIEERT